MSRCRKCVVALVPFRSLSSYYSRIVYVLYYFKRIITCDKISYHLHKITVKTFFYGFKGERERQTDRQTKGGGGMEGRDSNIRPR